MCRVELKDETCLVPPTNECGDDEADDQMDLLQSSSKLESLMEILSATGDDSKTAIFSQWTKFLDIVQARLDREGYKYCRLDGTMNATKRDAALRSLEQDPECTILLASLGVCAVGLNLTAANQIILSDTVRSTHTPSVFETHANLLPIYFSGGHQPSKIKLLTACIASGK
jgi:SWI/SNF-related matrix-associated actin-dependent regulator of chromatin subfamily A3